jgi:hypothetical protein
MHRLHLIAPTILLFTSLAATLEAQAGRLQAPQSACPSAPILERITHPETKTHRLPLLRGEWLVLSRNNGPSPFELHVTFPGQTVGANPAHAQYLALGAARVSLKDNCTVEVSYEATASDVGVLHCLSVHPVRPRPMWSLAVEQTVELDARLQFPTAEGPRFAAPVTAILRAGTRYRLRLQSDDEDVRLLVPAQNGLRQIDRQDMVENCLEREFGQCDAEDDFSVQFVAPRSGMYLFWCLAERLNLQTRPTVFLDRSDIQSEGILPDVAAKPLPETDDDAQSLVIWHRPDLWIHKQDPKLFVPLPPRTTARFRFQSEGTTGSYSLRLTEGSEHRIEVSPAKTSEHSVTTLEGQSGAWIVAGDTDGPIDLQVRLPRPPGAKEPTEPHAKTLQLPVVLRGRTRAGDILTVRVRGAGCAPQATLRGAGISSQCMDPSGFSQTATLGGVANRDGEVELVITATAAEPNAIAHVVTEGFEASPVGSPLMLDGDMVKWISTPGPSLLDLPKGQWTESDQKLPSGARVDWHALEMKAGHVYRVLASAERTPDLILDVPGVDRTTAGGGIAIVMPTSAGQATIGVAAAGADELGSYALQVCDLGPQNESTTESGR